MASVNAWLLVLMARVNAWLLVLMARVNPCHWTSNARLRPREGREEDPAATGSSSLSFDVQCQGNGAGERGVRRKGANAHL